jgi:hypothetical protein
MEKLLEVGRVTARCTIGGLNKIVLVHALGVKRAVRADGAPNPLHDKCKEYSMSRERLEIMEKARARRRRHDKRRQSRSTSRAANLTEKVLDLAQGATAQVGSFVKAAAAKVSGSRDDPVVPATRKPGSKS